MKQWKLKNNSKEKDLERLLLDNRGISAEDAEKFFNPDYERDLGDPLKILNMKKVVQRILKAIEENEKIVVFGDYDADGVCGAAIFHDFFKKINFSNFEVYIPDRYKEGYGLSSEAVNEFIQKNVNLVITVDCGITSFEETKKAMDAGIDVVITDHHLPPENIPPAYAIIDAWQEDDKYPFKNFSGAGIAFKTVSAILKDEKFFALKDWGKWLLGITAIATVADMVSLKEENRAIVYYGLKVLRKTDRAGLKALFEKLKINPLRISSDDLAFFVAPRINAASRMDHASTSFLLLTTNSMSEAEWISSHLEEKNNERKRIVLKVLDEIRGSDLIFDDLIIIGNEDWPPGILGLAAGKILDEFQKPIFVWGIDERGFIKISARSNSIDLVAFMRSIAKDIFIDIGGHKFAAGATIKKENLEEFAKELKLTFSKISKSELKDPELLIDKKIKLEDVSWETYKVIEKFEPFGVDNQAPIFWFSGLKIDGIKKFGNGKIHLELIFKKLNNENVKAIGFFMANQKIGDLKAGDAIDLAASFDNNYYNGSSELRLRIEDFKKVV